MWVFLWIVLSGFILIITSWSYVILLQQKQAWRAFAKKNGLDYQGRGFGDSAIVRGIAHGYRINLFSDAMRTNDARGERYVSVIEVEMGDGMPTRGAIGTRETRPFIENRSFTQTFIPAHDKWTGDYILKTRDKDALEKYLTPERIEALLSLFSMRNSSTLFFFDEIDCLLHIETSDPLKDPERLDRIVKRLTSVARVLDVSPGRTPKPEQKPVEVAKQDAPMRPAPLKPAPGQETPTDAQ